MINCASRESDSSGLNRATKEASVVQYIDMLRRFAWMVLLPLVCAAAPKPADWVPVRWPWADVKSLELLADSPVNCLLLKDYPAEFVAAAGSRIWSRWRF